MRKKVLVIGVIGADVHAVGNRILYHAFTEAGFEVVNLGVMVSQEEYIAAAIESAADAIVIGKQKFEDVEQRFKAMGFDRAFPPGTPPETTIAALREILHMEDEA